MVDSKAVQLFQRAREDSANNFCADCGTAGADWASVSHGIYLSIGASGIHRSLGVKVSFVQSTTMDALKPVHLRMMELGGNRRFSEFLRSQGVPEGIPLREKYRTRAAEWYRKNLRAQAEESEVPAPLPEGVGHLPSEEFRDSTGAMLDQVFANAPRCGEMTRGGVAVSRSRAATEAAPLSRATSMDALPTTKGGEFPSWVFRQLDKIIAGKGNRVAEQLSSMSTGSMQGFGPEDLIDAMVTAGALHTRRQAN